MRKTGAVVRQDLGSPCRFEVADFAASSLGNLFHIWGLPILVTANVKTPTHGLLHSNCLTRDRLTHHGISTGAHASAQLA
jgi:hypothetical protein